jgi:cytochrome c
MTCAALALLGGLRAPVAQAAGDAAKGASAFATYCAECHSVKEGKDKKGPSLFATFGRPAAQREGFAYSDALRESKLVWTADNLSAYLTDPKKLVPGGKMKYDGLANAAERDNLIAYLATATAPK